MSSLSDDLLALLAAGHWPGNVRELQGLIERLVVLAGAEVAEPHHLALVDADLVLVGGASLSSGDRGVHPPGAHCTIDDLVREHVERVLAHTCGHKARAAKILGVDLSTLYRWQQKWRPP